MSFSKIFTQDIISIYQDNRNLFFDLILSITYISTYYFFLRQDCKMQRDIEGAIEDIFDKGVNHFNRDLYNEAIAYFTEVLEMDPDHPDALYYRAVARANNEEFDRAASDFTKALEKDPYDADIYIGRGQAWESMGRLKHSLADFKKALSIDPGNPDYRKLVNDLEKRLE